jgi:hypothetical protein
MHETPRVIRHHPVFAPDIPPEQLRAELKEHESFAAAISREAAERETAYLRFLSGSRPHEPLEPPPLKQPTLPNDFAQQVTALDEAIYKRGVAVSRDQLVLLGQERFEQLLLLDREARSAQRIIGIQTDLTSWPAVEFAFAASRALEVTGVPPRKMSEIAAGKAADRERVRHVQGFRHLWKAGQEPQLVRSVLAFHDAFASLIFGQSMLERIESDGRVRSHLFCDGPTARVGYFTEWLSVLEGAHFRVTLVNPLWHVLAWLTNEKRPFIAPADLAREWFGVRAPTRQQVRLAEAVLAGWLRGHRQWLLWQFVGRKTRRSIELRDLAVWCADLAKRYPAITRFHDTISQCFWRDAGGGQYGAHREHDDSALRDYLDYELNKLLETVSVIAAQAVAGAKVVARFSDWLLCEGSKPKAVATAEKLEAKLAAVFNGAHFQVNVEPL